MYIAGMRWHRRAAAAAALLLTAGCAQPARHASGPVRYHCSAPFNAGGRIPGVLNPAYPRSGLYPASGDNPPSGAPGVFLRMRAPALVVSYGQPLAATGASPQGSIVTGRPTGTWWQVPLAAGYTFRLFGPAIPLFGVIPAPVLTGAHAARARYVWLVTQWDAVQTLTLLRGSDTLAAVAQSWRLIPPGISATNNDQAAAYVRQAEAEGWQVAGTFPAKPACGASPDHLSPFGARATLKVPLGVPLQLVSPEYGGVVLEVTAE